MKRLECAGRDCQQYCAALNAQGVPVTGIGEDCSVPRDLIVPTERGYSFDTGDDVVVRDEELVGALGRSLCGILHEAATDTERAAVSEVVAMHHGILSARVNLWQAMIDASRSGRQFTDVELAIYSKRIMESIDSLTIGASQHNAETLVRAQAAFDHWTLKQYGLLLDDAMLETIDTLVGDLMESKSALLVGDKGIAKTGVAQFVAGLWTPGEQPLFISGHGDMMTSELMGQMQIRGGDTKYESGEIVDAITQGRPVVLDEVNLPDPSVLSRLHTILLTKPGQSLSVHEGKMQVQMQPGFVMFATANEASARYLRRHVLDPAFRDRFHILQVRYPDSDTSAPVQNMPVSLMRLAMAVGVNEYGELSPHINPKELETLVRLAHVTQHLYSVPARNAKINLGDSATTTALDDEPVLTDCITPRALADIVKRCASGNKPGVTIKSEMERAIAGLDQAGATRNQEHARRALALLAR